MLYSRTYAGVFTLTVSLAACAVSGRAQVLYGSLTGNVTDASDAAGKSRSGKSAHGRFAHHYYG